MKAIKAFFSKVWAWVLAHKIVAGVIAGAVTLAIVTAIVVPVSVSSSRKKRAAEETQQNDGGGSKQNDGSQGDGNKGHTHTWQDPTWTWTGYESAVAHFVCADDKAHTHDETASGVAISSVVDPIATCTSAGTRTYTATVTFEGKNYSNSTTENIPAHGHEANEYGFCAHCNVYMGETLEWSVQPGYKQLNIQLGENIPAGFTYYGRVLGTNGHEFYFNDCDGMEEDEVSCYTFKNGTPVELDIAWENPVPVEVGDDGYIYIVATESTGYLYDAWFEFCDCHLYNEAGVCPSDGAFLDTISHGNGGYLIPQGSESHMGISYTADSKFSYYKIFLDIYPFENHKFRINLTNIPASHAKLYYVGANFEPHELTENDVVPVGVDRLYVALEHKDAVTNGSFALQRIEHAAAVHGYCEGCHLELGTELTLNTFCTAFTLENGATKYFYYYLTGASDGFDILYSTSDYGLTSAWVYKNGEFTVVDDGLGGGLGDDEYILDNNEANDLILIEFTNTTGATLTDMQIKVTEYSS